MPDDAAATVGQLELFHGGEEYLGLHLDSLREKLSSTRTQDAGQGIEREQRKSEAHELSEGSSAPSRRSTQWRSGTLPWPPVGERSSSRTRQLEPLLALGAFYALSFGLERGEEALRRRVVSDVARAALVPRLATSASDAENCRHAAIQTID